MGNVEVRFRPCKEGNMGYLTLVVRHRGQRITLHTGERLPLACWREGRAKGAPRSAAINARVDALRVKALEALERYRYSGSTIPVTEFRYAVKGHTRMQHGHDLIGFFRLLIDERAMSKSLRPATLDTQRRSLRNLERYAKHRAWGSIPFHRYAQADFVAWMRGRDIQEAYITKTVGHICEAMEMAMERGYQDNVPVKRMRPPKAPLSSPIYLSGQEIAAIAALPLRGSLCKVRDSFLIGCHTGIRYSDTARVQPCNIVEYRGRRMLEISMQKVEKKTAFPIIPQLDMLLEKYPDGLAPASIQYANRHLKEIARMAGISRWEQVTTHTARRSFATNQYLAAVADGRSYAPIMRVLGHTTEKMFLRYVRVTELENAAMMVG